MSEEKAEYKTTAAALQQLAAIMDANRDVISIPKAFIELTGDIEAAIVLDELFFWTLPRNGKTALRVKKNGVLWLAVPRAEWWDRKRLTARQADRAIDKLVEKKYIAKETHLFAGRTTTHLRILFDTFITEYTAHLQKSLAVDEQAESLTGDINDLYEMMGIKSELPNGNAIELPNGDGPSPNGNSMESPNGNTITSLVSTHPPHTAPAKKDFIDGMLEIAQMPGAKKAIVKQYIAERIKSKLGLNPSGKDAESFIDYAANEHKKGNSFDAFLSWWIENNPKPEYWSFRRMEQMYPRAFQAITTNQPIVTGGNFYA